MQRGPPEQVGDVEVEPEACSACGGRELLPPLPESGARVCLACGFVLFPEQRGRSE